MNIQHRKLAAVALAATTLAVAACASSPSNSYRDERVVTASAASYAVVQSIEAVPAKDSSAVAGTVVGGVVGGVIGHQIGSGRGNDAATAAGAIGGAIVGHEIQQHNQQRGSERYRVRVRMRNGSDRTFLQDNVGDLRVGQEVRIQNDQIWR